MSSQDSSLDENQAIGFFAKVCIGVGAAVLIGGTIVGILVLVNVIGDILQEPTVADTTTHKDNTPSISEPSEQDSDNQESSQPENSEDDTEESTPSQNESSQDSVSSSQVVVPVVSNNVASTSQPQTVNNVPSVTATTNSESAVVRPDQLTSPLRSDWQGFTAQPAEPDYYLDDGYVIATCGGKISDTLSVDVYLVTNDADALATCHTKLLSEVRQHDEYAEKSDEELESALTEKYENTTPLTSALCDKHGLSCGRR